VFTLRSFSALMATCPRTAYSALTTDLLIVFAFQTRFESRLEKIINERREEILLDQDPLACTNSG
jgi:hypothetical protein